MEWIKIHYPDDPVNPSSYRADIIGCSINHTSTHHYPGMPKFLWFNPATKKYRLATEDDPGYDESEIPKTTPPEEISEKIDGVHISDLSPTNKLHIPKEIRGLLDIVPGDKIGFIISENGSITLKKAKIKVTFE